MSFSCLTKTYLNFSFRAGCLPCPRDGFGHGPRQWPRDGSQRCRVVPVAHQLQGKIFCDCFYSHSLLSFFGWCFFFWIRFLLLSFLSSLSRYSGNLDGGFICTTLTGRAGITLLYVIGVPSNGRNSDPPNLKPARLKGLYLTTALSRKQSKPSALGDVSLEMFPGRVG